MASEDQEGTHAESVGSQLSWRSLHADAMTFMVQAAESRAAFTGGTAQKKYGTQTEGFDDVAKDCLESAYFDAWRTTMRESFGGQKCLEKFRALLKAFKNKTKSNANRSGLSGDLSAIDQSLTNILKKVEANKDGARDRREKASNK